MEELTPIEEIRKLSNAQEEVMVESDIEEQVCKEQDVVISETTNQYQVQVQNNKLVDEIFKNETAIDIAKEKFNDLKNQKRLAKGMGRVVSKKANADLETADLKVDEQRVANKVEKARQRNELLECKQKRKFLKRENKHKLDMQRFEQRKEKYGDLLLRYCRKKTKNADGKWEYLKKNDEYIINMPSTFTLFWLIVFDSIVMFLNQTAEVFGSLNKIVFKVFWIILICLVLFIQPIREWILSLIGIKL